MLHPQDLQHPHSLLKLSQSEIEQSFQYLLNPLSVRLREPLRSLPPLEWYLLQQMLHALLLEKSQSPLQ
jgi:hypothetical protein